jgi:hypothetical protein
MKKKAVKLGAMVAERQGTVNKKTRAKIAKDFSVGKKGVNAGYISGKKDMAAAARAKKKK